MSTEISTDRNSSPVNLRSVVMSCIDEIGGDDEYGRILGREFKRVARTSSDSGEDTPHRLRQDNSKLLHKWATFISRMIEGKDKLEIEGGIEQMETEELQEMVVPLMVEWVKNDEVFCKKMLETVYRCDPEFVRDLLQEVALPYSLNGPEVIDGD